MAVFSVGRDFETSERAGAGGMFQINLLLDENEDDITNSVDVGIHFHSDDDLKAYLSKTFNIPIADIDLEDA